MSHTHTAKKGQPKDWHKADILAALIKAGWNLSTLARAHGYSHRNTLSNALYRGWPKGEEIIAWGIRQGNEFPNIQPADIWPSRYSDTAKSTRRKAAIHGKNTQGNRHEEINR